MCADMTRVKDSLQRVSVRPSKERGQNFLIDTTVIHNIVSFGAPTAGDTVVEIGPGLGALTKELIKITPVTVIEIEEKFCQELSRYPEISIINQDVRTVDFATIGEKLVVFGNLPYSFSTEIVFHLIEHRHHIARAVLMLQKEFADRMGAKPGGKDYGVLSISVQLFCNIKLGPLVRGDAFHPPTKVDSRVFEMEFLTQPRYDIGDMVWFKRVVKAGFLQRRKKLSNSLKASGFFTTAQITAALASSGVDGSRRAETLEIPEFIALSNALLAHKI